MLVASSREKLPLPTGVEVVLFECWGEQVDHIQGGLWGGWGSQAEFLCVCGGGGGPYP